MFNTSVGAVEKHLPISVNIAQEAQQAARMGQALILLVSLPDCRFCEEVRRDHLRELVNSGKSVVREISINGNQTLLDFKGKRISQAMLAKQLGAKIAPTVFFLGTQGQLLAEPIVGSGLPDFYGAYLEDRIKESSKRSQVH